MDASAKAFLFDLLNTPSPTGFEVAGQRRWAAYVRDFADAVDHDAYGNTWATLEGTAGDDAPRLMLEAHADEIGFMVNRITEDGFLRIVRVGGSDRAIASGRRVRFLGEKGEVLGVIGNTAIHLRDRDNPKVPEWHDLFVDIGASNADEVSARGLRVGHPGVYDEAPVELTDRRIIGRALDNRMGGFIMAQVLARLAEDRPAATVHVVNAVQEEIGGNGARMVTYRLQPDYALVLDVTHATGSPGISKDKHGEVVLGGGPSVTHGTSNQPQLVARMMAVAEAASIPLQHEASSRATGTDTDKVFVTGVGVPSMLVSLPLRYMHSPVEMADLGDIEQCIDLITAFARSIVPGDVFHPEI